VLNHLHFPRRTVQTLHAHPSIRLGIVARGAGIARSLVGEVSLRTGDVFLLPEHEIHAFTTVDSTMDVIAFHPDSDHGPTDADHPMINRTYIANTAARS
jgi:quercetin dioxygenase-like cupin family protein